MSKLSVSESGGRTESKHAFLHFTNLPSTDQAGALLYNEYPISQRELAGHVNKRQAAYIEMLEDELKTMRQKLRHCVKSSTEDLKLMSSLLERIDNHLRHQTVSSTDQLQTIQATLADRIREPVDAPQPGSYSISYHGLEAQDVHESKAEGWQLGSECCASPVEEDPDVMALCEAARNDAAVRARNDALPMGELAPERRAERIARMGERRGEIGGEGCEEVEVAGEEGDGEGDAEGDGEEEGGEEGGGVGRVRLAGEVDEQRGEHEVSRERMAELLASAPYTPQTWITDWAEDVAKASEKRKRGVEVEEPVPEQEAPLSTEQLKMAKRWRPVDPNWNPRGRIVFTHAYG